MKCCVVIGSPVAHSLSPVMHNAAYAAMGLDSQYHFAAEQVTPGNLEGFMSRAKREFHALAVTIPHKETILMYLDRLDPEAKVIGAVNTVLNEGGILTGYNTDSRGAVEVLKKHTGIKGKQVAVLGSGGTARAIIYGLMNEKANATVYARNRETVSSLVRDFGCRMAPWEERNHAVESGIIINTTPLGRENEAPPFSVAGITAGHIVFDVNYNVTCTKLLNESKKKGATVIDGMELLLKQGMHQFELMTGSKAPEEAMRKALNSRLKN